MVDTHPTQPHLFCFKDPISAFENIWPLISSILSPSGLSCVVHIFNDTHALFNGRYPGYRSSNTPYHDLSHTLSVVAASARLLHGCVSDGLSLLPRHHLLALIAAFFHDVGLIQSEDDVEGSGAKYLVGHEARSIGFMRAYLSKMAFSEKEIGNCANFIRCTQLGLLPQEISFPTAELRTCGYVVGSADLLAQLADRDYLEKLLFLYREMKEAGLPDIGTEIEFFRRSVEFHEVVAKKRLQIELEGVRRHMRTHFRYWMGVDADLYIEAILRNHEHLENMIAECRDSLECCEKYLRRVGITAPGQRKTAEGDAG